MNAQGETNARPDRMFYHGLVTVLFLFSLVFLYRIYLVGEESLSGEAYVWARFGLGVAALLALVSFTYSYRQSLVARALLVFLISFVIYLPQNDISARQSNGGDNIWYVPTAISLLGEGNVELSEYMDDMAEMPVYRVWINNMWRDPRLYHHRDGSHYNKFPIGASLAVVPTAFIGNLVYGDIENRMERCWKITYFSGKCFAALAVSLLFVLVYLLTARVGVSSGLAALFALATPQFSMHGAGLWSHSIVLPFVLLACIALVAERGKWAWSSAIPLSLAYLIRPDSAVITIVATLYVLVYHRSHFIRLATTGALFCILFMMLSRVLYGEAIPSYYSPARAVIGGHFIEGLFGILFSPNRGLFVFAPIYVISLFGVYVAMRRRSEWPPIYRWIALMVLAHVLVIAYYPGWAGGHCYGPRRMANVFPLLVVLMVPAFGAWKQYSRGCKVCFLLVLLPALSWSTFAQYRGVTDWDVHEWNYLPSPHVYSRIWRWDDLQILRGFADEKTSTPPAPATSP